MASSELGSFVDSELDSLGINTKPEVDDFRELPHDGVDDMTTVLDNISSTRGKQWTSRKRVRSDSLRLFHEGEL